MEITQEYVSLQVADGTTMAAYTATPRVAANRLPAIILIQEAFGVNHHIRKVVDKYAEDGYVVIAPEMYHRTAFEHFEAAYTDFNSVTTHLKALTTEGITADLKAAYAWLTDHTIADRDNIFSIGYCMGGRVSFIANATLPLKAAVSYYGGGLDQYTDMAKNLNGPHLFFWGGKDQHIKQEQIDAIIKAVQDAAKEHINVTISHADHGFNCDERPSYNVKAAKEALALTLTFLRNNQ